MSNNQTVERCLSVNIGEFLLRYDRNSWQLQGKYLRNINHDSCVVDTQTGYWFWNSTGLYGRNIINFLQRFYGLSFLQAVRAICSEFQIPYITPDYTQSQSIKNPVAAEKPWDELYDYLCGKRKLDPAIVESLVSNGTIFLSTYKTSKNIVFKATGSGCNHYEITGIGSKRFKLCSDSDNFWSFKIGDSDCAYICESAIDAISLYELTGNDGTYISICGSANRINLINKILDQFSKVYLAVDNDYAGNKAASMLPELNRLVPVHKDWNEDLKIKKGVKN